jgi:hypothetical protein
MPALLFLLLFCNTFGTMGLRIVQTSSGFFGTDDPIDLWVSTLSFLSTISITLMLRRERP